MRRTRSRGSALKFCKQMCFERMSDDRTRVASAFHLSSAGGALGHATATMLGHRSQIGADRFADAGQVLPGDGARAARCGVPPAASIEANGTARNRSESPPAVPSASSATHGPGAPTEDVLRPGLGPHHSSDVAAVRSTALPQPAEPSGHFPPAMLASRRQRLLIPVSEPPSRRGAWDKSTCSWRAFVRRVR